MYNDFKFINSSRNNSMETNAMSYVRVLHAVPDAPNVDVYANDKLVASNLAFSDYTDYIPVPAGNYKISLYVAGTEEEPVLENMLEVFQNAVLTVVAAGDLDNIELIAFEDSNMAMDTDSAMVRFAHLSPNAPAVDITLPDGTVLFEDVSFMEVTQYIPVPPMRYTLQVRAATSDSVVLTVPGVDLNGNEYYTVYAIGLAGETPELQALLIADKNRRMRK